MKNENDFDRILLFKPQRDMTYIRKLSMSYGYYTALAVVNKQDIVTHIGANNNFKILPFSNLNEVHRNILGREKCKHLSDDDIMSIYKVESPLKLISHYHLIKPCKGMRYALPEETRIIKNKILYTLSIKHGVSMEDAEELESYTNLYKNSIPLNFTDILFNKDLREDLMDFNIPTFNSDNAKGQTKLF